MTLAYMGINETKQSEAEPGKDIMRKLLAIGVLCGLIFFAITGFGQGLPSSGVAGEQGYPYNAIACAANPADPSCRVESSGSASSTGAIPQVAAPSIVADETSTAGIGRKPQSPTVTQAAQRP